MLFVCHFLRRSSVPLARNPKPIYKAEGQEVNDIDLVSVWMDMYALEYIRNALVDH